MLEHAGHHATSTFEDVGHSGDARIMMKKYFIGLLKFVTNFYVYPLHNLFS